MSILNETKELNDHIDRILFENILPFWLKYSIDNENGGFWGRVTNDAQPVKEASKGLILNARILWTFSALYNRFRDVSYLLTAHRAFDYLMNRFWDTDFGGMFWSLDFTGKVVDDKKKMYGQAFAIYALSEYYKISKEPTALQRAIEIFHLMLQYSYDSKHLGFLETGNRDWSPAEDMRLSEKDLNEKKSMNTHLHIMEAFTNLYRIWPRKELRDHLKQIVRVFFDYIYDKQIHHLRSFFEEDWTVQTQALSYGHDIEASWLLTETLNVLGDKALAEKGREISIDLVATTLKEGLSPSYGIYNGCRDDGQLITVTEWWQQAEGAVGCLNAFQLTGEEMYLKHLQKIWQFIENTIIDWQYGEWFYEVDSRGRLVDSHFKISEWKGPYHNIRVCLELLQRLDEIRDSLEK